MKIVLETNVKEDDLFITNRGLIPFKEIEEDYLTIGKYQFKIRRDIESGKNVLKKCREELEKDDAN